MLLPRPSIRKQAAAPTLQHVNLQQPLQPSPKSLTGHRSCTPETEAPERSLATTAATLSPITLSPTPVLVLQPSRSKPKRRKTMMKPQDEDACSESRNAGLRMENHTRPSNNTAYDQNASHTTWSKELKREAYESDAKSKPRTQRDIDAAMEVFDNVA